MSRHHALAPVLALALAASGCSLAVGSKHSATATPPTPAGTGTPADPAAGDRGPAAAAPEYVAMPDLTGMTEAEARKALADLGLTGNVYIQDNTGCERKMTIEAGKVCGQKPAPGARQSTRLAVTLDLAASTQHGGEGSAEWIAMPNVMGMSPEQATETLKQAGFAQIRVEASSKCDQPDVVCDQSVKPGERGVLRLLKVLYVGLN
jgi:hypothetical protein